MIYTSNNIRACNSSIVRLVKNSCSILPTFCGHSVRLCPHHVSNTNTRKFKEISFHTKSQKPTSEMIRATCQNIVMEFEILVKSNVTKLSINHASFAIPRDFSYSAKYKLTFKNLFTEIYKLGYVVGERLNCH